MSLAFVRLNTEDVEAFATNPFGKDSQPGAEIDELLSVTRASADQVRQESVVVVGAFERCEDIASGVFACHAAWLLERRLYLMIA